MSRRGRPSGRTGRPCCTGGPGHRRPPRGTRRGPSSRARGRRPRRARWLARGSGAAEARKPAAEPRNWTYSGRITRSLSTAASAAIAAARDRLSATSSRASTWTRATRIVRMRRWYEDRPRNGRAEQEERPRDAGSMPRQRRSWSLTGARSAGYAPRIPVAVPARGVISAARGFPPPWRTDLVQPASAPAPARSSPPPDGPPAPRRTGPAGGGTRPARWPPCAS